jgi:outer membrane protein assembly factor BamB
MEAVKQADLAAGRLTHRLPHDFNTCPAAARGIVAVHDMQGGLIGFDGETGKRLWRVDNCIGKWNSPVRWRRDGREYFISANARRAVCIEPGTGRIRWSIEDVGHGGEAGTVAVAEDYLVCGGSHQGGSRGMRGLSCYRISPASASRHWQLAPHYSVIWSSVAVYGGHVYAACKNEWSKRTGDGKGKHPFVCVELASGRVVGEFQEKGGVSSLVAADGRILLLDKTLRMYRAQPERFARLGEPWKPPSHAEATGPAYASGRIFFRGAEGHLYCYDLRKQAKSPSTVPSRKLGGKATGQRT